MNRVLIKPLLRPILFLMLLPLLSCQSVPPVRTPPPCPPPVVILPPFAIAEISHHDAQYFGGMSYLFTKHYYRAARVLLKQRSSLADLSPAVRDRLVFAWALADLHLGPGERHEGRDLLRTLNGEKTPTELKEASQRLLADAQESSRLRKERALLLQKLSQVKKTLKEFSNLEKSLK
ncbi:MAG: hypothetical protein M1537_07320 [Nitrospirae bacterium]|nr:hypothetical protein [Nitrospirota bacterium]